MEDNNFAGIILLLIGAAGLIANVIGVYTVYRCRNLHNSFGFLCLSQCIANSGVCLIFATWCATTTAFDIDDRITSSQLGKHIGQLTNFIWDASVYTHLSISINRFICISYPIKANNIFTSQVIGIFIAVPWMLSFCIVFPYFWVDDCYFVYDTDLWQWSYADTVCGYYISIYFDYYAGLIVFSAMLVIDMLTVIMLRVTTNKMAGFTTKKRIHQRKLEARFFAQSLCQSAVFALGLFCFYVLSTLGTTQWTRFFCSSFAWLSVHTLDGLILDLFHTQRAFKQQRQHDTNSLPFHT